MGWWWVPLLLLLASWLPGKPGIQAGTLGLWQWVVLVSWLPGVHPCLLCFISPTQWEELCYYFPGTLALKSQHQHCIKAIIAASAPLFSVAVGSGQHEALQEIVRDALVYLKKHKGLKPFEMSLQEAVDITWLKLSKLEEAPACIPPCGYQPAARVYDCSACSFIDCKFPVDCPVQDMWVRADETITLHCKAPFATRPDLPVRWMVAKHDLVDLLLRCSPVAQLRTQDLTLFEELQGSALGSSSLTLQEPSEGTIVCCLGGLSEPVVRKYFYLNASEGNVEEEKGLQARFTAVLHWPHYTMPPHHNAWLRLGLGLPLGFMALVLLLVVVTYWYRRLPNNSDAQTSLRPGQQGPPGDSRCLHSP